MGGGGSKSLPVSELIDGKTEGDIIREYNKFETDIQHFKNKGFKMGKKKPKKNDSKKRVFRTLLAGLLVIFILFLLTIPIFR
jgi:hypothetical protein